MNVTMINYIMYKDQDWDSASLNNANHTVICEN